MSRYTAKSSHDAPLQAGGRLEVESFNGSVEIRGADVTTVSIEATKNAHSQELLDLIEVRVIHGPGWVRVVGVRPEGERGDAGVSFVITAPRQVSLERVQSSNGSLHCEDITGKALLETTHGSVHVSRFEGALDARTTDGSIHVSGVRGSALLRTTNGSIRASEVRGPFDARTTNAAISAELEAPGEHPTLLETSNGSIQVSLAPVAGDVRALTSNGSIVLRVPADTNARLRASTSNASVRTDIELTSGKATKERLEGTFGQGGPLIEAHTSNGAISVVGRPG